MTRTQGHPPQNNPPKSIARWVAGVVALCSGAATIYGLFSDKRVAVFAFVGMIVAIVLLLVVHRAIRAVSARDARFYDFVVKVLIAFVLLYFMALTAALFPSLFKWLTNHPDPPIPTPTPFEDNRSPVPPTPQPDFAISQKPPLTLVASISKVELGQKSTTLATEEFSSGAGPGVSPTSLKEFARWVSNQLHLGGGKPVPVRIGVEKFAGPERITERVCNELKENPLIQIVDPVTLETVGRDGIDYIISGKVKRKTP